MIPSIKGGFLPESPEDFEQLQVARQARYVRCFCCEQPFSVENTHTPAGWRETQISEFCEDCFEQVFKEAENSGIDTL